MENIALLRLDTLTINVTCLKLLNYQTIVFIIVQVLLLAILKTDQINDKVE